MRKFRAKYQFTQEASHLGNHMTDVNPNSSDTKQYPSPSADLPPFMKGVTGSGLATDHMSGNWLPLQTGSFAKITGTWETISSDPEFLELVGDKGEFSDRYRVGNQLGVGGNAFVYEGWRIADDVHVVIKVMRIPTTFDQDELLLTIKRFYREAAMIASLDNEHIRKCMDYGLFHGIPCMILEFVEGLTLTDLIKNYGSLPLNYATGIIEQLLGALDEPHRRGIIHRDIKPGNIMVFDSPPPYEIRVLDFGIATVLSAIPNKSMMTQKGVIRGTPSYMAPELFTGDTPASIESDLYAVGLVYLECLTGQVAVDATSYMKVAYKQVNDPLEVPGFIPPAIADIILKLCAKSPINRYHSAIQVLEDIHKCIDDSLRDENKYIAAWQKKKTYRTSTEPNDYKTVAKSKDHRNYIVIGLAAILVIALIAFVMGRSNQQPPAEPAPAPVATAPVPAPIDTAELEAQEAIANDALNAANQAAAAAAKATEQLNQAQERINQMNRKTSINLATAKLFSAWNIAVAKIDTEMNKKTPTPSSSVKKPQQPKKVNDVPDPSSITPQQPKKNGRTSDVGSALPF